MRNMKKKLIKFLSVIGLFIATLVAMNIGLSKTVNAASANVTFKMYDAVKYEQYSKLKKSVDRYDSISKASQKTKYWNGDTLTSKNNAAIACEENDEGYENYPYGWWTNSYCEAGTVGSIEVTYYDDDCNTLTETLPAGLGYTYEDAKSKVDSFAEQDTFTYGDSVLVEFYFTSDSVITSYQLGLNPNQLTKITSSSSAVSLMDTSLCDGADTGVVDVWQVLTASTDPSKFPGATANSTFLLGYVTFSINEQANCSATSILIDLGTDASFNGVMDYNGNTIIPTSVAKTLTITGGATKNNTTSGVGTPTISTATGSTTTGTVTSESNSTQTYNSFTAGTIGENDNSVSLSIPTSSDNSEITGISGVYTSVDDAVANINSRTGTTSYTGNIITSGISAGDTGYVAIKVTSEDGSNTEIYVIAIPKAESSAKSLDSITFGISGSSYSSLFTSPSLSNSMNVTVPSDASSLDLSGITFTGASIVINGTTYTSANLPSTVNVSLSAQPANFVIRVIAANSTSTNPNYKDYTVNITYKSVVATISGVDIIYSLNSSSQTVAATGSSPSSSAYKGAFKNSTALDYQVASFKLKATSSDSIASITGKKASDSSSIGSCNGSNSSSVSFASSPSAQTIKIILTVTSQWGNTADYEVEVSREQADTTCTFNGNPTVKDNAGNTIAGTWSSSGNNYTFTPNSSDDLQYTVLSFTLAGTLPSTATATYSIFTGSSTSPDDTNNCNGSATAAFGSGTNAITKKIVITITAEDGSTTSTYTVVLTREEADNDTSVNVSISDASGSDLIANYNASGYYENTIKLPYTATTVKIKIDVNTATTIVKNSSGAEVTGATNSYTLSTTGTTTSFSFTVIPENTSNPASITIKVVKTDPDDNTNYTVQILDMADNDLGLSGNGNPYTHTATIPNATTTVKIKISVLASTTTVHKDSVTGADASGTQIYTLNTANLTTDFTFKVVPQDPDLAKVVTFVVRITRASLNNNTTVHIEGELSNGTSVNFTNVGSDWSNAGNFVPYGTSVIKLKIYTDIATTYVKYGGVQVSDLQASAVYNNYNLTATANATTPTTLQFTLFTEANTSGSTFNVKVYAVDPDNTITGNLVVNDADGNSIPMTYYPATKTWKNNTKLPFGWTNVKYTFTTTATTSEAYINGTSIEGVEQTLTNQWTSTAHTDNISEQVVTIYTQMYPSPSSSAPTITIMIEQEAPSNTSTANLSSIKVTGDGNGIQYSTSDTGPTFAYTVPKGTDSASGTTNNGYYRIAITATDSTNATIYYSDDPNDYKKNLLTSTTALPIGNFGSPSIVYVAIYAQDQVSYTVYTFKVQDVDTRSNDAKISNITISETMSNGSTFQYISSQDTYSIYFDYSVKNITVNATKNDTTAQWTSATSTTNGIVDISAATSTSPIKLTYQLTAQNGSSGTKYTINVYRNPADSDNTIASLAINSTPYSFDSANKVDVVLNRSQATAYFEFTLTSSKAKSYTTSGTTLNNSIAKNGTVPLQSGGLVTISIVVKSEADLVDGGTGRTYTINIYAADQAFDLDDVIINNYGTGAQLLDTNNAVFAFDKTKVAPNKQSMTVPYGSASVVAEIVPQLSALSANASYTISPSNGVASLALGTNGTTFTIVVKSEYATLNSNVTDQSVTYIINIVRENPSYDATLTELKVTIGTEEKPFANKPFSPTDLGPYKIENVDGSTVSALISATANDTKATIVGTGNQTLTLQENASNTFIVKVTPEAGDSYAKEYKIIISRTTVSLDTNCDITDINIYDTADATTDLITFSQTVYSDTFNIRGTTQTLKVTVTTAVTTSTVNIKTSTETTGMDTRTRNIAVTPGQTLKIIIKCTSEEGNDSSTYEYEVNVATLDNNKALKTLTFDGTDVLPYINGVYYVGNSVTKINNIVAVADSQYATVGTITTPLNLSVGDNYFTVRVTSEDPNVYDDYSIRIVRDEDTTLSDLEALVDGNNQISYDGSVGPYSFSVGYEVTQMTVNYTAKASSAANITVTGDGLVNLQTGTNNYEVVVQSNLNPNSKTTYTITVTRASGSNDAFIETYTTEDGQVINVTKTQFEYTYVLPKTCTLFNPTITYSSGAKYTDISTMDRTLTAGINTKTISVTSQNDSVTNQYKFTIIIADSANPSDPLITDINVLDQFGGSDIKDYVNGNYTTDFVNYTSGQKQYTLNVPYTVTSFYLEVLTSKNTVTVMKSTQSGVIGDPSFATYVNSSSTLQSLVVGTNKFYIYAISEYGVLNPSALDQYSDVYEIIIEREAPNSDATLKSLTVKYTKDGLPVEVNATAAQLLAQELIIENIGNSVTSIEILGSPTIASTTLSGHLGQQTLSSLTVSDTATTGYIFTFKITTTAEDGTKLEYDITISRGPVDLNNDKTINYIQVYDSNAVEYLGKQGTTTGEEFSITKQDYNYTIPFGAQSFTIVANKLNVSPSKVFIYEDGNTPSIATTGSVSYTINQNLYGTTKKYIVFVQSQNGVDSDHYTISITFEAPSNDAKLKDLTVDGATVTGFNPTDEGGVYTLSIRPNSTDTIVIAATVNDPKSTVTGTGTFNLAVGPNSFTVTVTAQSGTINTYVINVVRDYPLPYLSNLNIVGEALLNDSEKETTFDKDTFSYRAIVTFMTTSTTIETLVDNINYTVNCSNSTLVSQNGLGSSFAVTLAEGVNTFTITVNSVEGKSVEYKLIIQRRGLTSTNTNISKIEIEEIDEFVYDPLKNVYDYTVENNIKDLTVTVIPEKINDQTGNGATYQVFNNKDLVSGNNIKNQVIILITAEDGETTRVVIVNVTRKEMVYDVDNNENTSYVCSQVSDGIYEIDLNHSKPTDVKDYTKYIIPGSNCDLSMNLVNEVNDKTREVVVSVSDGSVTKYVTFRLKNAPLSYEVDTEATEFKCENVSENVYKIDLGHEKAQAIKDYTKYIKHDENTTVEVLSNVEDENCNEVILKITDGENVEYVTLQLESSAIGGVSLGSFMNNYFHWILLIIAILILIIILICVNKDKYGSINKKRKKTE